MQTPGSNQSEPSTQFSIARCTVALLHVGAITMFVMGILGAQGIVSMTPGGAYAMIVLGSLDILLLISLCARATPKRNLA